MSYTMPNRYITYINTVDKHVFYAYSMYAV